MNNVDPTGHVAEGAFKVGFQKGWGLVGASLNAASIVIPGLREIVDPLNTAFSIFVAYKVKTFEAQMKKAETIVTDEAKANELVAEFNQDPKAFCDKYKGQVDPIALYRVACNEANFKTEVINEKGEKVEVLRFPSGQTVTLKDGKIEVTEANKDIQLSKHFKLREFLDEGEWADEPIEIDPELIARLELMVFIAENYYGTKVSTIVSSGYRSNAHQVDLKKRNSTAASPGSSPHEYGKAADISMFANGNRIDARLVFAFADIAGFVGIGYYDKSKNNVNPFTHVDVGNPSPRAVRPVQWVENCSYDFKDEYIKHKTEIWTRIMYNTYKSIYSDVYGSTVDYPILYHKVLNRK